MPETHSFSRSGIYMGKHKDVAQRCRCVWFLMKMRLPEKLWVSGIRVVTLLTMGSGEMYPLLQHDEEMPSVTEQA